MSFNRPPLQFRLLTLVSMILAATLLPACSYGSEPAPRPAVKVAAKPETQPANASTNTSKNTSKNKAKNVTETSCDTCELYPARLWVTVLDLQTAHVTSRMLTTLRTWADRSTTPVLANRNDDGDVALLAATYLALRQQNATELAILRMRVRAAMGSETASIDGNGNGESLALARNLSSLLISAKLLGLQDDQDIRAWARGLLHRKLGLQRRSLVSTHEQRANNWGTHAGAARIAIALFLDDTEELDRAAQVFRGWLGDQGAYSKFRFRKDRSWQAAKESPRGVNPKGATIDGFNVDGVLADDQRRGGSFSWPPPKEPYVWEALQGAVLQAQFLTDNGYSAFQWEDRALLRAVRWVIETAEFLPEGDDIWLLPLIDRAYGTNYSALVDLNAGRPGKNIGFTQFTHASSTHAQTKEAP